MLNPKQQTRKPTLCATLRTVAMMEPYLNPKPKNLKPYLFSNFEDCGDGSFLLKA